MEGRHLCNRLKTKGHQRRLKRVTGEVKEKSSQRKSCKIIGNELPITGIIYSEDMCHIWTVVALDIGLSPVCVCVGGGAANVNTEI